MQKSRPVTGRENQDLTQFINKLTIGKPYEVVNYREVRNLDLNNLTLGDMGNVLATLIADLKKKGIIITK